MTERFVPVGGEGIIGERSLTSPDIMSQQLALLRRGLAQGAYPGYPRQADRLTCAPTDLAMSDSGRLIIPDGPWFVNKGDLAPNPAAQERFRRQGIQLDAQGRPLHPWFFDMIRDPSLGVATGKGDYWEWGLNQTADSLIFQNGHVLLVKRTDTDTWALPGGFVDPGETAYMAAVREVLEETGIRLPPHLMAQLTYKGPVADIRLTAHAWPETTAFLFHLPYEGEMTSPPGGDGESTAIAWTPIHIALHDRQLFGSHEFLLREALRLAGATPY